jgi:all-trans-retinol 13,14-reductase
MPTTYTSETYKKLSAQKWDAIIIGSGLGGMTTGALLAKAGKRTLILERHYIPGGFTHTFKRKGFEWDVGVHYVGQVDDQRSILRKIFDYVSDRNLQWSSMGTLYDRAIIQGDSYDFISGRENLVAQLISYFPEEEKAIRSYIKLVKSASASSPWFFAEKTMPPWLSLTLGRLLRWKFERIAKKTTSEVLRSLTTNERLISVLSTQCGDYGLSPDKSSFGIHAVVVDHYFNGGSYPVGGAKKIHQSILGVFEKNLGTLVLQAEVEQVVVRDGRTVGVKMSDGQIIESGTVISNAGVRNTFERLVPQEAPLPQKLRDELAEVQPSTAHVCLYVGVNGSDLELHLPKNNVWIYDDYDFAKLEAENGNNPLHERGLTYISFPSAKDPEWAASHKDKATIQVIAPCSFEQVRRWQNDKQGRRGEDYELLKERISQRLLKKLIGVVPQIEGRIAFMELSTPLSTQHFMNYSNGEIYGLEHTPKRFSLKFLRPTTPIKGLYLTGQDIVTVGVGGALYSGVLAATAVLRRSMMLHILFNRPLKRA